MLSAELPPEHLISSIHRATVNCAETNGCVLNREAGCINLTDFVSLARSCPLEFLVFKVSLGMQGDSEQRVHLVNGGSVCPCREKRGRVTGSSYCYLLPKTPKTVLVVSHFARGFGPIDVTMARSENIASASFDVLVDLGRKLFPRFYELSEFRKAVFRPKEFVLEKMLQPYVPTTSNLPLASQDEFIMTTQSDSLRNYLFLEDWEEDAARREEGYAWFYSRKQPNESTLKRICYSVTALDGSRWHLVVQYLLRRVADELFAGHEFLYELGKAKPAAKITLLTTPENCALLGSAAVSQNQIADRVAARIVEPAVFEKFGGDRLLVVSGEWKNGDIWDGVEWKNNGSTCQKERIGVGVALKRVATLIPRARFANLEDQSPLLKKELVAVGGLTYLFYHYTVNTYKPRGAKKREAPGKKKRDERRQEEEEEEEEEEPLAKIKIVEAHPEPELNIENDSDPEITAVFVAVKGGDRTSSSNNSKIKIVEAPHPEPVLKIENDDADPDIEAVFVAVKGGDRTSSNNNNSSTYTDIDFTAEGVEPLQLDRECEHVVAAVAAAIDEINASMGFAPDRC